MEDFLENYSWFMPTDHNLQFTCWTDEPTEQDEQDYVEHIIKRIPNLSQLFLTQSMTSGMASKPISIESKLKSQTKKKSFITKKDDLQPNTPPLSQYKKNTSVNNKASKLLDKYADESDESEDESPVFFDDSDDFDSDDSDDRSSNDDDPRNNDIDSMSLAMSKFAMNDDSIVVRFIWNPSILKFPGIVQQNLPSFFITTSAKLNALKRTSRLVFPSNEDPGLELTKEDYELEVAPKDPRIMKLAKEKIDNKMVKTKWLQLTLR